MREMDIRVDGYSDAVWSIFGQSRMRGRFARSSKLVRFPSALPPPLPRGAFSSYSLGAQWINAGRGYRGIAGGL